MMEVMAEKFPGAFSGYTLKVWVLGVGAARVTPMQPQLQQEHSRLSVS
jgi:hypothetical protein